MTDPIVIPAALSPAEAEEVRAVTLQMLEAAKEGEGSIPLDIEGDSMTPCAVQMVVSATRTAERLGVSLEISEHGRTTMSEMQLN